MKYIAKISTVLILLVVLLVGVSAFLINKPQPEKIDTVFINEVYNGILKGEYINGKYDYTYIDFAGKVLYESKQTADMSYAERMNNALKNGYAVKEVDSNRLIFYVSNTDYFLSYRKSLNIALICIGVVFLFAVIGYCVYLYLRIIHPFDKLNSFAKNVAGGDLESTLDMSRHNNFGAFEEAFDIMRYNLAKEKKNAQKAEESKKQLMAEIGHDIKTPLMSIRAISEFNLLKNSDSDYKLILDKTNKIDRLISEIYQTALEEMGELSVCATEHNVEEIYKIIKNTDYNGYTNFKNKICDQKVIFDSFRLTQVVENILINSYKYANTEIDISAVEKEEFIDIEFKDYGSGVTESELSHIMDKFYRGEKVLESNGQGLGLYISRKLMNKMDGDLQVCNEGGFKVTIRLKKSE